jgi:hypothetical protein
VLGPFMVVTCLGLLWFQGVRYGADKQLWHVSAFIVCSFALIQSYEFMKACIAKLRSLSNQSLKGSGQ